MSTTPATGVANRAPVVDAGRDQTIAAGATATLDGTVMDDDTPVPLASVQITWSKQSGPGTVTFASATTVDTRATFSIAGTYVLALSASDTALSTTDTAVITVTATSDGGAGEAGGLGGIAGGAGGSGGSAGAEGGTGGTAGGAGIGAGGNPDGGATGAGGRARSSSGCGCSAVTPASGDVGIAFALASLLVRIARGRRPSD